MVFHHSSLCHKINVPTKYGEFVCSQNSYTFVSTPSFNKSKPMHFQRSFTPCVRSLLNKLLFLTTTVHICHTKLPSQNVYEFNCTVRVSSVNVQNLRCVQIPQQIKLMFLSQPPCHTKLPSQNLHECVREPTRLSSSVHHLFLHCARNLDSRINVLFSGSPYSEGM